MRAVAGEISSMRHLSGSLLQRDWCLYKMGHLDTDLPTGRMPCDADDKDWGDASIGQDSPKTVQTTGSEQPSPTASEGADPARTSVLDSGLQPGRQWPSFGALRSWCWDTAAQESPALVHFYLSLLSPQAHRMPLQQGPFPFGLVGQRRSERLLLDPRTRP